MPPAKTRSSSGERPDVIRSISTPLGFYVLALLIIEATLAIVLTCSKLTEDHVWDGFVCMLVIFACIVATVTWITFRDPTKLLYGKEEHSNPTLKPSALKDQIEDLIAKNVREECLKPPKK